MEIQNGIQLLNLVSHFEISEHTWRIRERYQRRNLDLLYTQVKTVPAIDYICWASFGVCGVWSEQLDRPQLNDYTVSLTFQPTTTCDYLEDVWYYRTIYWDRSGQVVINWSEEQFRVQIYREWFHKKGQLYYDVTTMDNYREEGI